MTIPPAWYSYFEDYGGNGMGRLWFGSAEQSLVAQEDGVMLDCAGSRYDTTII